MAYLTCLAANSHLGGEQLVILRFNAPLDRHGQLIGIMAAVFMRAKAAICAAHWWNCERE
jgi:hypothetical protein